MNGLGAPRLFVVDDERVIAETTVLILRQRGFDAVAFTEPLEALKNVVTGTVRLLITDVRMPVMSGVTWALRVKEIDPAVKILLISAMAATEDLSQDARTSGFDFPILYKPIHPVDLVHTVQLMLERPA